MELEKRVTGLISKSLKIPEENVKLESSFVDDLGADSLDIVELVMAMEDEFQIDIPDKDAESIKTVRDAVDYIKKSKAA
jgi:acyl carrier protein